MRTFISTVLGSVCLAHDFNFQYMQYVAEHGKFYSTVEEYAQRLEHFIRSLGEIERLNANEDSLMKAGLTKFSDWSEEEFQAIQGLRNVEKPEFNGFAVRMVKDQTLPSSVDWRTSGDVTDVKDQGNCGSCWAFSATGALESATSIKTGTLPLLSEQQFVDCSRKQGNLGCHGGWYYWAYDYLHASNKLETETQYPYTA